ncbi:putative Ubiquitin-like protein 3 [Hypsibius exemplaris]|uniref:Ubiquitin-like protein 3 n=1 Tax=Hypsibius exemplaris TaxID=2072580 RepID=A0A1W0WSQ8_HYPEX|nr:putative Ubiquitin-like protein 3 [Hypsibius exemplaris]
MSREKVRRSALQAKATIHPVEFAIIFTLFRIKFTQNIHYGAGRLRLSSTIPLLMTMASRKTPADMINLKLIIVSGKTKEFLFLPTTTATEIAHHVYDNWPEDWGTRIVTKAEILRLIYHGRFLHGNVTLGALNLPLGKTTVMHLVPREHLPEPNSQDDPKQKKTGSRSCCSSCCTIC